MGIGNIKTLALTFSNYIAPTSTEPLGNCATAADVATKKCFHATFKHTHMSVDYATSSPLTSKKGLVMPWPYYNNVPANQKGQITVGQGDLGLSGASYGFEFRTVNPIPMDAFVDIWIPIGFTYDETTVNTMIEPTFKVERDYVVSSFTDVKLTKIANGHVRVKGLFIKDKAAPANKYVIYYMGDSKQTDIAFELSKFINTIELPSVNPFFLTIGYESGGVEYAIESYVLEVNMELPA